jgi:hypothetical protein
MCHEESKTRLDVSCAVSHIQDASFELAFLAVAATVLTAPLQRFSPVCRAFVEDT